MPHPWISFPGVPFVEVNTFPRKSVGTTSYIALYPAGAWPRRSGINFIKRHIKRGEIQAGKEGAKQKVQGKEGMGRVHKAVSGRPQGRGKIPEPKGCKEVLPEKQKKDRLQEE